MTLNNHIPFMAKNKTEKRKFIEQIFNLEIFSKMLFELRNEHNEVKKNFDIEITRLEETNNYLTTQKTHRDNFNNDQENKIKSLKDTIQVHKNDLKETQDKLSDIEALDDQPYKDKLVELETKLTQSTGDKEEANRQCIEQTQIKN
mgnify:FL=1